MDDTGVILEKLALFSRMLRLEGFVVGIAETEDAARILTALGMEDREKMKTALRTVYAKSREEQLKFDRVFDGFFISEEAMRNQAQRQMEQEREQSRRREQARQELEKMEQHVHLSGQQRDTYTQMPEDARKKLQSFLERYRGNMERNPQLYGEFIHSVFAKTILEQQMLMENAGLDCEAADPELGILYRDIGEFRDSEIPKAIAMIQTVARQINGELSAKRKSAANSAQLNFRKTIRKGLETGGTFRTLSYRKKPSRRKRLVLLCDVSGSMVQFSEFALRFIQSLNQVAESSRTFLFSEKLVEADPFQLQNMDLFRSYVRDSGIYGRGTDLGSALEEICSRNPPVLSGSTTLLILSDTKSVDQQRAMAALLEAKRRSGRVLWLNPIPESKWKYLRSVSNMQTICPMISCSTLRELAAACRKLTKI